MDALAVLRQQPYALKLAALAAATLLQAAWLRGASRVGSPAAQAAAVAPVLAANALAPLVFSRDSEPVTLAFAAFLLTWLGSFKAAALAAGRGPLVQEPWSLAATWVLYVGPLVPLAPGPGARAGPGPPLQLFLRWLAKLAATAAAVGLLREGTPPFARTCLYCIGLYSMLGVAMDGPAALLLRPLRLTLAPHFVSPWEAQSVAAFWGSHWNLAASNALRTCIYDPIVEGSLLAAPAAPAANRRTAANGASAGDGTPARRASARLAALSKPSGRPDAKPDADVAAGLQPAGVASSSRGGSHSRATSCRGGLQRRRLLGMSACFFASGAVHELIYWYVTGGHTPQWRWLAFFTGQVLLVALERRLLAAAAARWRLPRLAVRRAITLAVLLATGHHFFFKPAEALAVKFAASVWGGYATLAAAAGDACAALPALPARMLAAWRF